MEINKDIPQKIRDEKTLYPFVRDALNENPMLIIQYKQGKQAAFTQLVSAALKKTQGLGEPEVIRRILGRML
jgi:Asp-tRNA(Asn)/Glu-tRNA(Gln) amidotransferase B subunit